MLTDVAARRELSTAMSTLKGLFTERLALYKVGYAAARVL